MGIESITSKHEIKCQLYKNLEREREREREREKPEEGPLGRVKKPHEALEEREWRWV